MCLTAQPPFRPGGSGEAWERAGGLVTSYRKPHPAAPRTPQLYHLVKARLRSTALTGGGATEVPGKGGKEVLDMLGAGISNATRKAIYRREGYRCALCDSTKYLQVHHVVKRSRGGSDGAQNLICLCADCHALAHGTRLRDGWEANQEDVEQAIVEYLSDFYACQGVIWNPWNR